MPHPATALTALLAIIGASHARAGAPAATDPAQGAADLVAASCLDCHGDGVTKGKLDLKPVVASMRAGTVTAAQRALLRRARVRVEAGEMPPAGTDDAADAHPPLAADARTALASALRTAVRTTGDLPAPPGPPPRRLNRSEYSNAVRDLLDIDIAEFGTPPPDDVGAGFDNVASVLSLPPRALENYMGLAETIAARACPDALVPGSMLVDLPGERLRVSAGAAGRGGALVWSNGTAEAAVNADAAADYEVSFSAGGMQAGSEPVKVAVLVDGKPAARFDIPEPADRPGERRCTVRIGAGRHTVAIEFLNDYFERNGPGGKPLDRNLVVYALRVQAPKEPARPQPWQQRLSRAVGTGADDGPQRQASELRWLAGQFLRRPATDADVAALSAAIAPTADGPREARLRAAITALLVHPAFLFRIEPEPVAPAPQRTLAGHEVAARLAAFLWCSVPDEPLLSAAAEGRLERPDALRAEIERMLDDARASRLADRFAPQWLAIDAIEDRSPDQALFPGVDAALLGSMRAESVLFFDAVLRERRPAATLLDADFTFVDERLARHYGLPVPTGGGMRRAAVDPARGGGVLAQAAVLLATSNPTRTSPVKRGKWVLDSLLDSAPPPPPPGTPQLPDTAATAASARSMRELLAAHRADPACAACHRRMDALGFAFEAWDPVGRHRDRVGGQPVDDLGELPDGRTIAGLGALRRELAANPDFLRSLARHLLTFATGKECGPAEDDLLDRLLERLGPTPTLRDMVIAIAESTPMRMRGAS